MGAVLHEHRHVCARDCGMNPNVRSDIPESRRIPSRSVVKVRSGGAAVLVSGIRRALPSVLFVHRGIIGIELAFQLGEYGMNAEQYVTYQAFFRRIDDDGNYIGWIAHDTRHVEQMPSRGFGKHGDAKEASWTLRHDVTMWAHGLRLSRLPAPLPWNDDKPSDVTSLPIEVPYTPEKH